MPRPLPPGSRKGESKAAREAREASTRVAALVEGEEGRGSARVAALSYRSGVPERHPNSSGIKSGPGGSAELGSPGGQRETSPFYPQENTPVPAKPGYLTPSQYLVGMWSQDVVAELRLRAEEAERGLVLSQAALEAVSSRVGKAEEGMEAAEQRAGAAKRMEQEWQRSNKSVVAMWTAETARAEKAESDLASTLKELQGELHRQSYHRSIVEDQSHWFTAEHRARAAEELYGVSGNFSRVVQENDFLRAALGLRPE